PLLSLVATAAWLLWVAGFARATRLPTSEPEGLALGAWVGVGVAAVGGVGAAWIEALLALPAAGEVIRLPASLSAGSLLPIAQPSGGWSPLLLGLPLLVLFVLTSLLGRRLSSGTRERPAVAPSPLLPNAPPLPAIPTRVGWGPVEGVRGQVIEAMSHSRP